MKSIDRAFVAVLASCLVAALSLGGCATAPSSIAGKKSAPAIAEASRPATPEDGAGKAKDAEPAAKPAPAPEAAAPETAADKPAREAPPDAKAASGTRGGSTSKKEGAADSLAMKAPAGSGEKAAEAAGSGAPKPAAAPAAGDAKGRGSDGYAAPEREAPSESGLKAGYSDDNEQFNYFVKFLSEYGSQVESYPLKIGERIVLSVKDSQGKPVCDADVAVQVGGRTVASGRSYASGAFHLYPLEYPEASSYTVLVSYKGEKKAFKVARDGPRSLELRLGGQRKIAAETPLDILFVLDTTGSMGEEIGRLQEMIEIIHDNVSAVTPKPAVRFGLVLYRDRDDAYVTKVTPFTADMDAFQVALDDIEADGGGDNPEDLQSALSDAIKKMDWNRDGVRLAFVVTDAEPHLDYGQSYTYASAARDAKAMGIKLYAVGTGGLPLQGEYVLRQISQFTAARYIFLTYGEKGESEGGAVASVSHHTGSNFQTDKLEAIIIRFAREELAYLSDAPLVADDSWFDAKKLGDEKKDVTLGKLFGDSLRNLIDYSTIGLKPDSKAALVPIGVSDEDKALSRQAEYFSEALLLATMKSKPFVIVDRKDLQKILEEQQLQYSGLVDDSKAVKLGSLLGAEVMVTGKLYEKDGKYEIFLKLLRVETGEVLSVTKAKLDEDLGL